MAYNQLLSCFKCVLCYDFTYRYKIFYCTLTKQSMPSLNYLSFPKPATNLMKTCRNPVLNLLILSSICGKLVKSYHYKIVQNFPLICLSVSHLLSQLIKIPLIFYQLYSGSDWNSFSFPVIHNAQTLYKL